jgi:NAD(P)H-nitrite reductase large subunit
MDKDFLRLIETVADLIPQSIQKLDDESLICECFCVSAGDIRQVCESKVDLEKLQTELNLGNGCQSCLKNKDKWLDNIF